MKVFALTVLVAVGASGFSSNRNACPTLQDAANAFESHFGTQARKYNPTLRFKCKAPSRKSEMEFKGPNDLDLLL